MFNPHRAEIELILDGEPVLLKLNLGALAALEKALGEADLAGVLDRFSNCRPCSQDLIHVLNAGLYGAGETPNIEVRVIDGGALRASEAAAELLAQAFPKSFLNNAI